MWVCISDYFDKRQIIIKIISSALASAPTSALANQENVNSLDIKQLQIYLRHKLSGQKYLLEMDAIWNDDSAKWIELKDLIKVGGMGSKILHYFAYSSLFPKDFGFAGAQISSLWAGLGLLRSPVGSRQAEHIAAQYIDELHTRSFLEDFEDFGHIYYFKLHDLALYVAKEDLLVVNLRTCNIPEQARHLSVVENDSLNHALFPRSRSVRTILFPIDGMGVGSEALLDAWITRYIYLRLLELGYVQLETLPKGLGMLISHQHLHLTTKQSILFLPKLKVLSVRHCKMLNLSLNCESAIHKLRMKFLHLEHCPRQQTLPQWILGAADTLQTLLIINSHSLKMVPEWLTTMTHLKMLHIVNCSLLLCLPSDMHHLIAL
ncbi:Disease resistance protein RGA2-like protein [Glycine soja]|nr:Disease resistance protein RGA2-like protein [Glycine soja]